MYTLPADRQAPPTARPADTAFGSEEALFADSLLSSPFFWLGGAASILVWTGVALAILRYA